MKRQFISDLAEQDPVNDVFRAVGKRLRTNNQGNLYLQLELCDRSGTVQALMWNASDAIYRSFEDGEFVRVEGRSQVYQGNRQVIVTRIARVPADQVEQGDFQAHVEVDVSQLRRRLSEKLLSVSDPDLRALAETFLADAALMDKLSRAPAGVKNHHAYRGGLLEHIVSLMQVVSAVAPCYPELDIDLLTLGAFLHDIAKVDELGYDLGFEYTDEGQLIGHLVMAVVLLEGKLRETEARLGRPLQGEMVLRLKHMIVSHHGEYEYGSPKLPMTPEAIALHLLDNLDAKLHAFAQLIADDPNKGSAWTNYQPSLARKLFKGRG